MTVSHSAISAHKSGCPHLPKPRWPPRCDSHGTTAEQQNHAAYLAFRRLGARAEAAVPVLIEIYELKLSPSCQRATANFWLDRWKNSRFSAASVVAEWHSVTARGVGKQ